MAVNAKKMQLDTVGGGALIELFERDLQQVLGNIADPNTSAKSMRKITMEIVFKPDEDRKAATITVASKAQLAGTREVTGSVFLGREKGANVAYVNDVRQEDMFPESGARNGLQAVTQ